MKRWISTFILSGILLFGVAGAAHAQVDIVLNGESTTVADGTTLEDLVTRLGRSAGDVEVTHNGTEIHRRDLDDVVVGGGDRVSIVEATGGDRFGFGIGAGLVNLDEEFVDDDVEQYLTAHLRIAFGDTRAHRSGRRGLQGYIEPEIAVWDGDTRSDTMFGVNIIGSIPFNAVDFFVGAGIGLHMLEQDAVTRDGVVIPSSDEDAIGVNAQFGVDVHLSETVTVFGTGRFDIIDDSSSSDGSSSDALEAKVYLGLRFLF